MTRFLTLINYTDQGIRDVKDSGKRAAAFGKAVEAAGGKLLSQYWCLGEVDGCATFEVPDEETGASVLLALGQAGNVRTKTVRLYDNEEFQKILTKVKRPR